jgi:hypothetical protein
LQAAALVDRGLFRGTKPKLGARRRTRPAPDGARFLIKAVRRPRMIVDILRGKVNVGTRAIAKQCAGIPPH